MIKRETVCYLGTFVVLLCLILYVAVSFDYELYEARQEEAYTSVTAVETIRQDVTTFCTLELPAVENGRKELAFYTVHQNVSVYIDGELIYHIAPLKSLFGHSLGCMWHFIPIAEADFGKEVLVELTSPYAETAGMVPPFVYGEKSDIIWGIVGNNGISIFVCVITLLVGITFILYTVLGYSGQYASKDLWYLGLLAVDIGIWKLFDMRTAPLLFGNEIYVSYVAFIGLMLLPIPFVLFLAGLHGEHKNMGWRILELISYLNIIISIVFLLADIADLRQTLWTTHATFGIVIAGAVILVIWDNHKYGISTKSMVNIICLAICAVGTGLDVMQYYIIVGEESVVMGSIGFFIYIVTLGMMSIQETRQLLEASAKAQRFEQLAYRDSMTGFYNRLAWSEMSREVDLEKEDCTVIMLDLNNLKKCNDTLGHERGDDYIVQSAKIIEEATGSLGECFRVGGDEFCVLVHTRNREELQELQKKMEEKVEQFRDLNAPEEFGISWGWAYFDKRIDLDLNDTRSRADAEMYRNKFKMKSEGYEKIRKKP